MVGRSIWFSTPPKLTTLLLTAKSAPIKPTVSVLRVISPAEASVAASSATMLAALLIVSLPALTAISAAAPLIAPLRLRSPAVRPMDAVVVALRLPTSTLCDKLMKAPPALAVAVSTLLVSSSISAVSLSVPRRAALRLMVLPAVDVVSSARSVSVVASRMPPPAASAMLPARLVIPTREISPEAVIARSELTRRLAALVWVKLPALTARLIALANTLPLSVKLPAVWLKLASPAVSSEPTVAVTAEDRLKPVALVLVSVARTEAMAAASKSKSSALLPTCLASSDSSPLVRAMLASVSPLELSRISPPATSATAPSAPTRRARWMSPEALRPAVPLTLIVLPLVCKSSPLATPSTSEPALRSPASCRLPCVTCRFNAPVTLAASMIAPAVGKDSRNAAPKVVVTAVMRPTSRSMSATPPEPMLLALRLRLPAVMMLASSRVVRSTTLPPALVRVIVCVVPAVTLPLMLERPSPVAPASAMLPAEAKVLPSVMFRLPPVATISTDAALMLPARLRLVVVASSFSAPPMLQAVALPPRPTVLRVPSELSASTTDKVAAPLAVTVLMVVASSLSALPAAPSVVPLRFRVAAVILAPLTPVTPVMAAPLTLAVPTADTCASARLPVVVMVRLPAAARLAVEPMLRPAAPKSNDRLPPALDTSLSLPATTSMVFSASASAA